MGRPADLHDDYYAGQEHGCDSPYEEAAASRAAQSVHPDSRAPTRADSHVMPPSRLYGASVYPTDDKASYLPGSQPPLPPLGAAAAASASYAAMGSGSTIMYDGGGGSAPAAPAGRSRMVLILLRLFHTLGGLLVMACLGAVEAYMVTEQFQIVAIPLTVCRLILASMLAVLILCDWGRPSRIYAWFPMYAAGRSLLPLGLSQISIVFFALADPSLARMEANRSEQKFARVLFPVVLTCCSLLLLCGIIYSVAGPIGGVGFRLTRGRKYVH
ncbi:hypothetical protein H4R18_005336 [Coemansia javaensis]|uniref:Uncharacterized protein n=1 Tax=Coemansia javaensis TaxID=2761396 RepID=A0A9W8LDH7_9FUNG|nr:hypothetical protein H4R18_005336 [Coemansia javaensis]